MLFISSTNVTTLYFRRMNLFVSDKSSKTDEISDRTLSIHLVSAYCAIDLRSFWNEIPYKFE